MRLTLTLIAAATLGSVALNACASTAAVPREAICSKLPEGDLCAFDPNRDASADLETAMAIAADTGVNTLLVMGADWCHDSRALAGHLYSERFEEVLARHYRLVFVDVAQRNRNIDIARRFGFERIKGTPTVIILDSEGQVLNREEAPGWRNAASRSADDIHAYLERYAPQE